jgi:hypothetical protein
MGSELDGLSEISSVGGSEVTDTQKASPAHPKSRAEESTRKIIFNSTRLSTHSKSARVVGESCENVRRKWNICVGLSG